MQTLNCCCLIGKQSITPYHQAVIGMQICSPTPLRDLQNLYQLSVFILHFSTVLKKTIPKALTHKKIIYKIITLNVS